MSVLGRFRRSIILGASAALVAGATALYAQDSTSGFWSVPWEKGPVTGRLGDLAEIQVPEGYVFTGKKGTKRFMELTQNPFGGDEYGTLAPASKDLNWFVVFEFNSVGYVKDDEKDKIDADKLLKSIQEGSLAANRERKKRGWSEMEVVGWSSPPSYNPETHNLEWGIRGISKERDGTQHDVANHSIRVLGRGGVMKCDVVAAPEDLEAALTSFRGLLNNYAYLPGHRYAEFRQGDKLAAVGLTGLVLGGAAVAAVKSGLFAKLLKPLLIAAAAFFASVGKWLARVFRGLFGRDEKVA